MTTRRACITLAVLTMLAGATHRPASAETQRFQVPFSDPSRPGLLRIALVNGGIEIEAHAGPEVLFEVSSDDEGETEVREVQGLRRIPSFSYGVSVEEKNNVMTLDSESWQSALHIKARVPARTRLHLETVNEGDIRIRGALGELELSNTNGDIEVSGAGSPVVAQTVNGDVKVAFARLDAAGPMAFSTLNGDIEVSLPGQTAAALRFDVGNGEIYSDFEVTLDVRRPALKEERGKGFTRIEVEKAVWGTINGGGPEIRFKTFNGDIHLRRLGG